VCDVWAATTNINILLSKGARHLLLVNADNVERAKKKYTNAVVIGQSLSLPITFFNSSNYPYDVARVKVRDKIILYMTNNGTKIIELAFVKRASKVFSVSFSNLNSLAKHLKGLREEIYLIPAGEMEFSDPKVLEDLICIQTLEALLKGKRVDIKRSEKSAKNFIQKAYGYQEFDQQKNFELVFKTNNLSVIPLYKKTKDGLIRVSNIY
jgi:phosphosulfolactate phosphohydrolase-like enzyme